jgi:hypothetical protein
LSVHGAFPFLLWKVSGYVSSNAKAMPKYAKRDFAGLQGQETVGRLFGNTVKNDRLCQSVTKMVSLR